MITVHKASDGKLKQLINADSVEFFSDVAVDSGGEGENPDPHALLDAALGACTALTITMVARRKQMPLDDVWVQITHREEGGVYYLQRQIELIGKLTAEQREYLMGIANRCPIHKVLSGRIEMASELVTPVSSS
jgi:putative redox protein